VKKLVALAEKVMRKSKIALTMVALGAAGASGLVFLGTTSMWLCVVTFLGALVMLRTWWVCEQRRTQDSELIQAARTVSRITQSVDVLSLEIANLSVQTDVLANSDK